MLKRIMGIISKLNKIPLIYLKWVAAIPFPLTWRNFLSVMSSCNKMCRFNYLRIIKSFTWRHWRWWSHTKANAALEFDTLYHSRKTTAIYFMSIKNGVILLKKKSNGHNKESKKFLTEFLRPNWLFVIRSVSEVTG